MGADAESPRAEMVFETELSATVQTGPPRGFLVRREVYDALKSTGRYGIHPLSVNDMNGIAWMVNNARINCSVGGYADESFKVAEAAHVETKYPGACSGKWTIIARSVLHVALLL